MKAKVFLAVCIVTLMGVTTAWGQNTTKVFKVYGNCGMCESRIEKAAKSVKGVTAAEWDKTTQMAQVTFDSTTTDVKKVEMAIAKVGHDTELYRAKDETYNALPGCCKYDRAPAKKEE